MGILETQSAVRKRDGTFVEFEYEKIVAWRKVELPPHGAGKGAPLSLRILEMEIAAAHTWPARHQEKLGEWVMRATGKYTMRANSVLVLGDPGVSLEEALSKVYRFYASHKLPPVMHVPLPIFGDLDDSLEIGGWALQVESLVMAVDIESTEEKSKPDYLWSISESFDDDWLRLQNDFGVSEIMSSVPAAYASLRIAGQLVAVGRACNFREWTVLARLFVHPEYRRMGIGAELLARLLNDAAKKGADKAILQVDSKNTSAIGIYESYGFKTHHSYRTRALRPEITAEDLPVAISDTIMEC